MSDEGYTLFPPTRYPYPIHLDVHAVVPLCQLLVLAFPTIHWPAMN